VSQKSEWRRFVEARRAELHDVYPCAMPTHRHVCPKHRIPVPQEMVVKSGPARRRRVRLSGICKPCRDELYEQLAGEYRHVRGEPHVSPDASGTERGAQAFEASEAQADRGRPSTA
jgi:hypothetical protein